MALGFGVWGLGFRVWGVGFEVSGFGFRVLGFRVEGTLNPKPFSTPGDLQANSPTLDPKP